MNFIYFFLCFFPIGVSASSLNVKAWQSRGVYPESSDYPELSIEEVRSKPNTGIAFSGGGSRSFGASVGYLAGIHKLGLLKNVRYMAGISGGSWFTSAFTYAQNVTDDSKLLGRIIEPEHINLLDLQYIDDDCMRRLTKNDLTVVGIKALKDKKVGSVSEAYCYGVADAYLEPLGITSNTRFTYSEETYQDIIQRNPELASEKFLFPTNKDRPYMILGSAMVGPTDGAPYHSKYQNFTMIEFTSLYTGQMRTNDISYHNAGLIHTKHINKDIVRRVGGMVENIAFSRDKTTKESAPEIGLKRIETNGILNVPSPEKFLDLQFAAGTSGYAVGAFMESSYIPTVPERAGLHYNYWSPTVSSSPEATDMLFTDGGCFENLAVLPLLQRQVSKIVLFENSGTALKPKSEWDVTTTPPSNKDVDTSISSLFGMQSNDNKEIYDRNFDYKHNQVFASEDFTKLILLLQDAQEKGNGCIATMKLTTVENEWWGINAGFEVELTVVYLSRLNQWESKLSDDMKSKVIPNDGNPNDMSNTIDKGMFKHFPHYKTAGGLLSHEQTNLLADMTGWSILQNKETFEHMLS